MKSAPVRRAASATGEIEKFSRKFHHVPDFKKLHQINQTKMEQKKRDDEELRNKRPKTAAPVLQAKNTNISLVEFTLYDRWKP